MKDTQGGTGRRSALFLATLALLAAFFIASYHLQHESLWSDEAWTMWAVSGPRLRDSIARVASDVHPPLYFVVMDVWVSVAGESVYTGRLPSTLFALLGLAATYAVGVQLFDRRTGLLAVVILGTVSFFVYYAREARMYSLLLALSALATWDYLRWVKHRNGSAALTYALFIAALLYTHYYGLLVILAHVLHGVIIAVSSGHMMSMRKRRLWTGLPYGLALAMLAPWLPFLVGQIRSNPDGPLAAPLASDRGTVAALVLMTTSGHWGLLVAPFALGRPHARRDGRALALVLLWLLLAPVVVLALNAWVVPTYQLRYVIAILPAGALLVAYGLSQMRLPVALSRCLLGAQAARLAENALVLALLSWIVYTQLAMYSQLWPAKPRWDEATRQMAEARQPLEPAITDIAPHNPAAYYDRLYAFRRGLALDLGWRDRNGDEMRGYVALLEHAPSVWAVLPSNIPQSWDALAALDAQRGIGYRDSLINMIFYRFDQGRDGDLQFRFADLLRYSGAIAELRDARAGESLCVDAPLIALRPLDGSHTAGLRLVAGYNTVTVQHDLPLGERPAGEAFTLSGCLDFTPDPSNSDYHVFLSVFNSVDGQRLPLLEGPGESNLYWGETLAIATVRMVS